MVLVGSALLVNKIPTHIKDRLVVVILYEISTDNIAVLAFIILRNGAETLHASAKVIAEETTR